MVVNTLEVNVKTPLFYKKVIALNCFKQKIYEGSTGKIEKN